MSVTIWVPGIGNVVTFDGAKVPPGGHLVTNSPSTSTNTDGSIVN